jgi:hypothetical protein
MKRSVTVSFFGHFFIALLLFTCTGSKGGKDKKCDGEYCSMAKSDLKRFLPAPSKDTEIFVEPAPAADAMISKPKKKRKGNDCKDGNWYGGIGVQIQGTFSQALVSHSEEGYPAYEAGIRDGDVISAETEMLGEPGTTVEVFVVHKDKTAETLKIIRGKICYEKDSEKIP